MHKKPRTNAFPSIYWTAWRVIYYTRALVWYEWIQIFHNEQLKTYIIQFDKKYWEKGNIRIWLERNVLLICYKTKRRQEEIICICIFKVLECLKDIDFMLYMYEGDFNDFRYICTIQLYLHAHFTITLRNAIRLHVLCRLLCCKSVDNLGNYYYYY